mmetsp:Transcript_18314/g.42176  ORF Transcript_18314/g.42176 Transcript_18314/m.42176 type:complete len:966 (+) Transcript_18314:38-2935(+)
MAFLSSNPSKGSVTVATQASATNKGALEKNKGTRVATTTKSAGATAEVETNGNVNLSSLWSVFQDRLLQKDEKGKDSNKPQSSCLNEELKRVESKAVRRSSSHSQSDKDGDARGENIVLLSKEIVQELELQERLLPDRWLDFFCIVGLHPDAGLVEEENNGATGSNKSKNKPVLLDRYPKEDRDDMEFPHHLPTFCFPDGGCRPLRHKIRPRENDSTTSEQRKKKSSGKKKEKAKIKCHYNAPDPFLCNMVLTSGAGNRLYCTVLTVYEMRDDTKKTEKKEKKQADTEQNGKKEDKKLASSTPNKNWWEKSDEKSKPKNIAKKKEVDNTNVKVEDEYYWIVPKCLVLMSHYPFFQAQSIALKELFYTVQSGVSPIPFERYVAHLLEDIPLPRSGIERQRTRQNYTVVEWRSWTHPLRKKSSKIPPTIRLERPPPNRLPLLNVSMEPLFRTMSLSNILVVWANLLQEGKVVLACSNSETTALLAPIAEALLALLFPLEWQGIYVPVLPNHDSVLDVLEAPVPYLIGLVTKPSKHQTYDPRNHPNGVLWCDLDNDTLHLGFKGDKLFYNRNNQDGEEIPLIPALPSEASMALKAELEEIADPLYLPTIDGIKGRITVGDRTIELDNALRQPYAQRTKLFNKPMATPRKYILTQSSKIPLRGKVLKYEDFSIVLSQSTKKKVAVAPSGEDTGTDICGLTLVDIQIPCGEDTTSVDVYRVYREEEKLMDKPTNSEVNVSDDDNDVEEDSKALSTNLDSTFLSSLKRQSRSMQAHVDRAMAVLGQDYATPSQYAARSSQQFGDDVLNRQDEIAANLFSVNQHEERNVTERARESFLRFFLVTFARYKFYFDAETNRMDDDRFVTSLNYSHRQKEYVKDVVTSQMFEIFLHDTRSIKQRKLFGEYIAKHKNGSFSVGKSKELNRCYGTPLLDSSQWNNPSVVVPEQPCRVGLKEGRVFLPRSTVSGQPRSN